MYFDKEITNKIDEKLEEEQFGFSKGKGMRIRLV